MPEKKLITKKIWMLSFVSLLTDMASEMLYPVMPLYLKEIGFTIAGIGILEGLAEAIAGLSKGYFGTWSDHVGKRVPFIKWGYALSAISKPLMAIFINPWQIFLARAIDRTGKGIRTAPRDALLASEATNETLGRVFGLHRAMDTLGAAIGPGLALAFLFFFPQQYRTLFLLAFIPGVAAVLLTLWLKEKPAPVKPEKKFPSFKAFYTYWVASTTDYKKLTGALLVFALFNSSDIFLLLRMKESGMDDVLLLSIYIIYNAIFALLAFPAGMLADRLGYKKVMVTGFLIFALVYAGMSVATNVFAFAGLMILYGLYAAATEGVARAWITRIVNKEDTAKAIGTYTGFQSIMALLASTIAGLIWYNFGSMYALISSAVMSIIIALFLHTKTRLP